MNLRATVVSLLLATTMVLMPGSSYAAPGVTQRVSVASSGEQANGLSDRPVISADGRFVAFEGASAANLIPNDTNGVADIFVRDRELGTTERVSVDTNGAQSDNGSAFAAISADGRFVAFQSIATNLVSGDTNNQIDVFVHDRQTQETARVSVASDGSQAAIGGGAPAISGDGRYVAFASPSVDLVPGDTNGTWDVFVHDRQTATTSRISVNSLGVQGNGQSTTPALSSNGRFVGFVSEASNLVPGDSNGARDLFLHDLQTATTTRASLTHDGGEANGPSGPLGNTPDHDSYLSADGRYVTFSSAAFNLVPGDTNGAADVFVRDRQLATTTRVSVDSTGVQATGESFFPTISADGRFIAFGSLASDLVANDTNNAADVFLHDRQKGNTVRISLDSRGAQGNGNSPEGDAGFEPPIVSNDGTLVAFASFASNLVPGDTNGTWDIFVHDTALSIGGVALLPGAATRTSAATEASDNHVLLFVGLATAIVAGTAAVACAVWFVRPRRS